MSQISKSQIQRLLKENQAHRCPPAALHGVCVKIAAVAQLPTRFGKFQIVSFSNNKDQKDHLAVVKGDVLNKANVYARLHSECLTGDALGSLRCDCRDQLITALEILSKKRYGVLLYLRQEGRGIGLANKIKAYALQDQGFDTIQADHKLGFSGDEREYDIAAHMLYSLKIKSVNLLTNNPRKIQGLENNGIKVVSRVPLIMPANRYNRSYLHVKQVKAGHLLDVEDNERAHEQDEKILVKLKKDGIR
ncbi:MAG: GTP cyclohydrolase II [Patescibacteria group bacterium]|nr:GTP cyclohydrolase II [Patescibacteria group bacterium]